MYFIVTMTIVRWLLFSLDPNLKFQTKFSAQGLEFHLKSYDTQFRQQGSGLDTCFRILNLIMMVWVERYLNVTKKMSKNTPLPPYLLHSIPSGL